jgi:hypothetical protein
MKHWAQSAIILVVLSLASTGVGCNRGHNYVSSDGTKVFGERKLKDGTVKRQRTESPSGEKAFNVTVLSDGTAKMERVEYPDGEKQFDVTRRPDGTTNTGLVIRSNGVKQFDCVLSPDGSSEKIQRAEFPNGIQQFDVTVYRDSTGKVARNIGREVHPDGTETPQALLEHASAPEDTNAAKETAFEAGSHQPLPTWEEMSHWSCRKYADEWTHWGSKERRGDYAVQRTHKASELVGYGQVEFSISGDDGQWLYIEGHPETEDLLRQTANLTISSQGKTWADNRKAFCECGFENVTWKIVYGSSFDSRSLVVARYTPTIKDALPDIAKKMREERRKAKILPAKGN